MTLQSPAFLDFEYLFSTKVNHKVVARNCHFKYAGSGNLQESTKDYLVNTIVTNFTHGCNSVLFTKFFRYFTNNLMVLRQTRRSKDNEKEWVHETHWIYTMKKLIL